MKIAKSRLWGNPGVIKTVLFNVHDLDPSVILTNPVLYHVGSGKRIASFLSVRKHKKFKELKTVYTHPRYRGDGFSKKLIMHAISRHGRMALTCRVKMKKFYERFGFREDKEIFTIRVWLFNNFLGPIFRTKIIAMIKE
jgi:GNAT superfamily N-acetyltransferase